jgi:acetyl-CoA C-acetyltransferase
VDAYVYDVVRTPRGKGREGGALSKVRPITLLAQLFQALGARSALRPADVDDVILGCSTPRGELGANLARTAAMYAGWGERASGATVNRFCASGLEAIASAASRVACGMADVVIAGGVEAPSRVPMMSDGGVWFEDREVAKKTGFLHMAVAADLLATKEGIAREELDAVALRSHERAARAWSSGAFARTVVPVVGDDGAPALDRDECVRQVTLEKLAALPPLFPEGDRGDRVALARFPELSEVAHRHTAGTSPAMADGAALSVIGSRAAGERLGLAPRGRILAFADVATDPVLMLAGNPAATRRALDRAGLSPRDVAVFEVNESFAAVPVHFARALEVEPERLNPNGGAIALGHPLGATGVVLLGTLLDELERRGERRGVVSICAGAGIAAALVVERA